MENNGLASTPPRDSKKGQGTLYCCVRPSLGTNNSKRPIPNPKAQGSDPLAFTGVNSTWHSWRLSWGAISKPTPARRPTHPGQLQSSGGSSPSQGAGFLVPEPKLCVEVSPTISSQPAGIGSIVEAPCHDTATQTTLHRPLVDLPAGEEHEKKNIKDQGPLRRPDWRYLPGPLTLEPGLGLGLAGEHLVAGSLPTGPGRAQPKMATWARLPASSRLTTTRRKVHEGPVQCGLGSSRGGGPRRPNPWTKTKTLAIGTWNVTSLGGKEPELSAGG
ncbi:hypothetical protein L3Q82_017658 [Scortum barcoo]|uniref:Uncharacterized protein n=1 Tax=Scortum barcoo TaxID=214431 RepID=A0ACB8VLG6_9TELE|nr:hypothetical protein L3Q82_017658 [Scortum barcoo]